MRCAVPLPVGAICGRCLERPPRFATVVAPFLYRYPVDALIQSFKYGGKLALAGPLAHWLMSPCTSEIDLIVPMPLAPARLAARGFNQAHEIASRLARLTGRRFAAHLCRKVIDTPPQAGLPWRARASNVRRAFACDADLGGLKIAVVDDVMTTGATLDELARTLLAAGAAHVEGWVLARAVRGDGYDGMNEGLVAPGNTRERSEAAS